MSAALSGQELPPVPYTLSDMAADAVGLLDHLGIDRAHVLGASMGGMIAQTIAIEHPERCLSLVSVMSSPGDPRAGQADTRGAAGAADACRRRTAMPSSRPLTARAVWTSKRHHDAQRARDRAAAAYDRAFYPEGAGRQLAAIYASGDRSEALADVAVPTLVIHGRDDTLITPSGGTLHRRGDPQRQPAAARRHGPRPPAAAVAAHRRRHHQPHHARRRGDRRGGTLKGRRHVRTTRRLPDHRDRRHRARARSRR